MNDCRQPLAETSVVKMHTYVREGWPTELLEEYKLYILEVKAKSFHGGVPAYFGESESLFHTSFELKSWRSCIVITQEWLEGASHNMEQLMAVRN